MALQKKKRNIILKLWKKNQLKKLRKISIQKSQNRLFFNTYDLKNIYVSASHKLTNVFDSIFSIKVGYFYIFKKFAWLPAFFNDFKNIKYSDHLVKSHSILSFLINFHDNIMRDFSSLKLQKSLDYVGKFSSWNKFDIRIILNKIKKILKYFYTFLNYFSFSLFNYFLIFFNFFNKFNKLKKKMCLVNLFSFFFLLRDKKYKRFYFEYILYNKILLKNKLLYQNIEKSLGKFFHRITYKKNKDKYSKNLKYLRKKKRWLHYNSYMRKFNLIFKKLKGLSKTSSCNYSSIFFRFNISSFQRHAIYPKFLINTFVMSKLHNNTIYQQYHLTIYKKKFSYFKNSESTNFYNKYHIKGWDYQIFNIFNFKSLSSDLTSYVKKKFYIFQDNFFNKLLWSWHIVFSDVKEWCNIKFFNFNVKDYFLNFFYKIYKIRTILAYLIFALLPLNLNLIWLEFPSKFNSKIREISLNILKSKVSKNHWFFDNRSYVKKITDFYSSVKTAYLKRKQQKKEKVKVSIIVNKRLFSNSSIYFFKKIKFLQNFFKKFSVIEFKRLFLSFKFSKNLLLFNKYKLRFFLNLIKAPTLHFDFLKFSKYYKKKINFFIKKINRSSFSNLFLLKLLNFEFLDWSNFVNRQFHNFNNTFLKLDRGVQFVWLSDYEINYSYLKFKNHTLFSFLKYSVFKQSMTIGNFSKRNLFIQNLNLYFSKRSFDISNMALLLYKYELRIISDGSNIYKNSLYNLKKNNYFFLNYFKNLLNNLFFNFKLFKFLISYNFKKIFFKNIFFFVLYRFFFFKKFVLI